jgi:hypothetical protein
MDYALVKDGKAYEGDSFEDALAKTNCMEFSRSGIIYYGTRDVVTYSSTLTEEHYMMLAWDRARRILLEDDWRFYESAR